MKIKIVNESAFLLPDYKTVGSAGMDLKVDLSRGYQILKKTGKILEEDKKVILSSMSRCILPTNLRVQIPVGYEAQIRPRSGYSVSTGLHVILGTIDSDYTGFVGIIIENNTPYPKEIEHGERIAQMVISPVVQAEWESVEILDPTERGNGGFGSTGGK